MSRPFTSPRHLAAALALAALALGPTALLAANTRGPDVVAAIEDAAAGDIAPLESARARATAPGERALLDARIALARLDTAAVERALAAFAASGDALPAHRKAALQTEADLAFGNGDYARAVAAFERIDTPSEVELQSLSVARLLASEPRQTRTGGAPETVTMHRDAAGLQRAPVAINGIAQDAVLDTGANLSVVTASTAKRLGLRMIEGEASVGAAAVKAVPVRLAVADRLTIAGVEFAHVAFLVLDDAALSFPLPGGSYTIGAIIGFPVFRALGRVSFGHDGSLTVGGAEPLGVRDNLRAGGNDLYVLAGINGIATPLHLDTGAGNTALDARFAADHPQVLAGLTQGTRNIAGAGGARAQQVALWRPAAVTIGPRTHQLAQVQIVLPDPGEKPEDRAGTLGQDVLGAFRSYTIDFPTMAFALGDPIAAP